MRLPTQALSRRSCLTTRRRLLPRHIAYSLAIVACVFFLFHSFTSPSPPHKARITKVTERISPISDVYEASLRSHDEHNRIHDYDLVVFGDQAEGEYYSRAKYLLRLITNELALPAGKRREWLMWVDRDVILLNEQIPLDIFLPPPDFPHIHFLGTHDKIHGFNAGVFFIRVHEWSINLLKDVIAHSEADTPEAVHGSVKVGRFELTEELRDQRAFHTILRGDPYRDNVLYQPRNWYNTLPDSTDHHGKEGYLLTHFNELEGPREVGMTITILSHARSPESYSAPVSHTLYPRRIREFWERVREAKQLLPHAQARINEEAVWEGFRRLSYASTYETDVEKVLTAAIHMLSRALGRMDNVDLGHPEDA
ncbi:hypothetical protein BDY17DRAFT_202135 [Neohortaea acidophila]|uniref:Galactosyl transferase GMA12/MNN10 family-domain-containing protein n=1 Tax=Neohortaea acidophila TaxID=245834 RepID=A0A6A6PLW1_9PEZI|nr:uncharacterized protein BDY17DRAFT_202135 [Neohortaea acidophila]KAF2480895.1 hypothetical protein BDY17DRAFT_202135 [Neohortaea acidophila]